MKKLILNLLAIFTALGSQAQDFQEISTGAGYQKQSYVHIAAGTQSQVNNDAWDIAFTTETLSAGVFINESSGSSMGNPLPMIEVYQTNSTDFSVVPNPALDTIQLFNPEFDWATGALNTAADPTDPFDIGWGVYDPSTQAINGSRVFLVRLRNGQYRKLQIQSLNGTIYSFRYANLDGTNEATKTIDKTAHAGNVLAYFSFATGATVDVEPANGFDLVYLRYVAPILEPTSGAYVPYAVTGILSGMGVEVAEAYGVNPNNVQYEDWVDSLSSSIDVIGHDWKSFSGTAWSIVDNLAYFVKTANGNVWKIIFIDFEGSITGTAYFEKTDLGGASAVGDKASPLTTFNVYPNPTSVETNVVFTAKNASHNARLSLFDLSGRMVFEQKIQVRQGLNGIEVPVDALPNGMYSLSLNIDDQIFSEQIQVVR